MLNIAIVDDDMTETNALVDCLKRYEKESGETLEINSFCQAELFLEKYKPIYDLVFLDIRMDGMDGLRAAKKLRELDQDVFLIFVTNMAQMAIKGYKYDALDYFIKPVNYYDLKMRMERVRKMKKVHTPTLMVKSNGVKKVLNLKDVYYMESQGHTVIYHAERENYETTRTSISTLEEELVPHGFFRCNSCYLVNLRYCREIADKEVLVGTDKIAISRSKYKEFMVALTNYAVNKGREE